MGKWRPNVPRDEFGKPREDWVHLVKTWQLERKAQAHWDVRCKFCGAEGMMRWGTTPKGAQRYYCPSCKRTFVDNAAPPGMRFPAEAIAAALNGFYEGHSLSETQRHLQLTYKVRPDPSNIYRWIVRYTKDAVDAFGAVPVKVGRVWVADETVIKLKSGKEKGKGENIWFWDILDTQTRFLLASHLSEARRTEDVETLMGRALERAAKPPRFVITDKLQAYLGGIEETFGAWSKHVQSSPFVVKHSTRDIERFHGTLKDRTKVMRSLANRASARIVLDGWLVHYNFFRPHQGLKGRTPAEAAKAKGVPFSSWADVVAGERKRERNPNAGYTVELVTPSRGPRGTSTGS